MPRSAATPTRRPDSTTPTWPSSRRWPPTRNAWRSARPASTTTATTRPRADQQRAFEAQIELARETGKPLVIHTRAADEDTLATLDEPGRRCAGDPALLLDGRPDRGLPGAPGLVDLVRRQCHVSEGRGAADRGAARTRASGCWSRPTRLICPRRPFAVNPTSPPTSSTRRGRWRSSGECRTPSSRRRSSATRPRCSDGEHAPRARARSELPRRSQHPRRDRAPRRAGARRRRARDRRRAGGAVRAARGAGAAPARGRARPAAGAAACARRSRRSPT